MWTRALIVALAALALGGCGSDAPTLGKRSAEELHAQVAAVREAAGEGDRAAALKALEELSGTVRSLEDKGSLAEADAAALRRGIARARRRVRAELAAPEPAATVTATATPTATSTPEPTATAAPPKGKPAKPGKGKGKGPMKEKD